MRRWLGGVILLVFAAAATSQSPTDTAAPPKPIQPHQFLAHQLMSYKSAGNSKSDALSPWNAKPLVPTAAPPPKTTPLPKLPPLESLERMVPGNTPVPATVCPAPLEFPSVLTRPNQAPLSFPPINSQLTADFRGALEELKQTRERLEKERKDSAGQLDSGPVAPSNSWDLRFRLAGLLRRFDERNKQPRPPVVDGKTPKTTIVPPGPVTPPVTDILPTATDPLTLAEAQYRAQQFEAAMKTLEGIKSGDLDRRDQAWVLYLKAGCLRNLGKTRDAATIYREIAAAKDDPFLAEMAIWNVESLNWRERAEAELEKLRNSEKQP